MEFKRIARSLPEKKPLADQFLRFIILKYSIDMSVCQPGPGTGCPQPEIVVICRTVLRFENRLLRMDCVKQRKAYHSCSPDERGHAVIFFDLEMVKHLRCLYFTVARVHGAGFFKEWLRLKNDVKFIGSNI
ncbi:hypothetical protein EGT74_15550 [Chitinophaga lutea]|uniref:Uncharacterized protein n=1 Tax=Chitinophaga lutea TaxID=2488634 RepID=A0A3N4PXR8_9BACT|nr:hypothetical protein EGT74_15550 [Chitinophaga lutea]